MLAVLAVRIERADLEVDVAPSRECLVPGWHLRAVEMELDVVEALAVRVLHPREHRRRQLAPIAVALVGRRGSADRIDIDQPAVCAPDLLERLGPGLRCGECVGCVLGCG